MMLKKTLIFLVLALLVTGCTQKEEYVLFNQTHITNHDANRTVQKVHTPKYEYRIKPHDRISVTMYNHPELGTSTIQSQREDKRGLLVDARGFVRLPLIKNIHIAGLTQEAAQKKIENAFKKYLQDVEVYLEVLNKRAYIMGEIKNAGEVPLFNEKLTLLQLIASSGGFKEGADRQSVVILQKRANKIVTKTVDLTGVKSLEYANMTIYPNDVVYIPPRKSTIFNVGVKEVSPAFGLAGQVVGPIASLKYLFN